MATVNKGVKMGPVYIHVTTKVRWWFMYMVVVPLGLIAYTTSSAWVFRIYMRAMGWSIKTYVDGDRVKG